MASFISSKIQQNNELIAEELRRAREKREVKLGRAAKELNINPIYLEALENGQLSKLPRGLYGKKILQEYAYFLRADFKYLSALWENETQNEKIQNQQNLFSRKIPRLAYFLTIPKIIKNFAISLLVIFCAAYLGFYLKNIISPPALSLFSPEDNLTTEETSLLVSGSTEIEANITINNISVLTDAQGYFHKQISLTTGLNVVTITAQKKYSRTNKIIRRIFVEKRE